MQQSEAERMGSRLRQALESGKRPSGLSQREACAFDVVGTRYHMHLALDSSEAQEMKKKFIRGDRSACPRESSTTLAACYHSFMAGFTIKSTSDLVLYQGVAAAASLEDKKNSKDQFITLLDLLDNAIFTAEKVNLAQFHLSKIEGKDEIGKLELAALRKEDQELLADSKAALERMVLDKIKEAKATFAERKGLKVPTRVTNRYNSIVTRFRQLQTRKWTYSTL